MAFEYDVQPIEDKDRFRLVWIDSDGHSSTLMQHTKKPVLSGVARALNEHTRDDEVLISEAYDQVIREIMAGSGITYYDAVNQIFARGINAVGGTGDLGFEVTVGNPIAHSVGLFFQRLGSNADENVFIQLKGKDGQVLYRHQLPLISMIKQSFPEGWRDKARKEYIVFVKLENPEDEFHEALGEIGRKFDGVESCGSKSAAWTFTDEEDARSFMEEAAVVAAAAPTEGSVGVLRSSVQIGPAILGAYKPLIPPARWLKTGIEISKKLSTQS